MLADDEGETFAPILRRMQIGGATVRLSSALSPPPLPDQYRTVVARSAARFRSRVSTWPYMYTPSLTYGRSEFVRPLRAH